MAIRLFGEDERVEGPVEDRILIRFPISKRPEFTRIILKHQDVIEGMTPAKESPGVSIQRTIYLDRPDTFEREEIENYLVGVSAFHAELKEIDGSWTHLHLHEFSLAAEGP